MIAEIIDGDTMMEHNEANDNIWLSGMMGLVVGDAIGVPVQFMTREEIQNRECGLVTGMESGGVYDMPRGTWSDDSSMAIATLAARQFMHFWIILM
jgi:ADP-ribosylglycohydrolase